MELRNVYYTEEKNPDQVLDVFLPKSNVPCPILVYFHGGGLEEGNKDELLEEKLIQYNIGLVSVNYRLYPKHHYPDFLWDGAVAIKWVLKNLGDNAGIFVGGSSAGAFIAMMLYFDDKYFTSCDINLQSISGFIFNAGQPTTHYNILRERGLDVRRIVVDEAAPLFHINEYNNQPPMLLLCAEYDLPGRYEQTLLMLRTLKEMHYPESHVDYKYIKNHMHCDYLHEDFFYNYIEKFIIDHTTGRDRT